MLHTGVEFAVTRKYTPCSNWLHSICDTSYNASDVLQLLVESNDVKVEVMVVLFGKIVHCISVTSTEGRVQLTVVF